MGTRITGCVAGWCKSQTADADVVPVHATGSSERICRVAQVSEEYMLPFLEAVSKIYMQNLSLSNYSDGQIYGKGKILITHVIRMYTEFLFLHSYHCESEDSIGWHRVSLYKYRTKILNALIKLCLHR